ncbi:polyamine aminopropyltransferase [Kocuria flava]|uniref:polyamine aminopropyltransferase n=1 Tax=Kocuria flava TaxID=446860 RepID=UPI001C5CE722|nr:polyamine aminopropyltransferase [Kocuria flava]
MAVPLSTTAGAAGPALSLPVRPGPARFLVLLGVFVCAACGMVYELALVALGSYLMGSTVVQASVVLSVMVFAMGLGALASKPLNRWPALSFAAVEAALSLLGGLSVLVLYAAFAWLRAGLAASAGTAFVIGLLIGAEIPLLMSLLQQIRRQAAPDAVADMFAADYVGALLGGLAFPFLLLPTLGLLRGTVAVGAVNALVGVAVTVWLFRASLPRRARAVLAGVLAVLLAVLGGAFWLADRFEVTARQQLYAEPIVLQQRSDYQEIVLTSAVSYDDERLYLDGNLQFSSADEHRYHEALVHPAMAGPRERVLVLGGGDGLAVREILRYDDVGSVTLVDLDPAVTELARTEPRLTRLNGGSLEDPRVELVHADAFAWLRDRAAAGAYDVVVADLPDPDSEATAKLYSQEMYGLAERALAPGGRLVVQAGSPYFAPDAFWCVGATVGAAGLAATPYHVDVPSFGDWGFFLAVADGQAPRPRLAGEAPPLRFLTDEVLAAAAVFPPDRGPRPTEVSTLLEPVVMDYQRQGWKSY